jgi:hypothetical protein
LLDFSVYRQQSIAFLSETTTRGVRRFQKRPSAAKRVTLRAAVLSSGDPQIARADGDAPVLAYITAMPGWRRASAPAQRTHRAVPGVRKAGKWNYGAEAGLVPIAGVSCILACA